MTSITPPNYTQIPNVVLDDYLPAMSEAELKVTLVIARQTFGWHRKRARLSLSALETMTGLSRQGVINGINSGLERGTINRRKRGQGYEYGMKINAELVNEVDQHQSTKLTSTSQRSRPELVNEVDHIKESKEIQIDEDEEDTTTSWPPSRKPLTRKGGRKYPAETRTTDPAVILVNHMQVLIEQPNGLLRKYKEAAGVKTLGAEDIQTITAWIDFYTAKEDAGMDHNLACRLAYAAIRDANPAPVIPEPVTIETINRAQLASTWAEFLS